MTEQFVGYTTGGIEPNGEWSLATAVVKDKDELIGLVGQALEIEHISEEEYNDIGPVNLVAVYAVLPIEWSTLFPKDPE